MALPWRKHPMANTLIQKCTTFSKECKKFAKKEIQEPNFSRQVAKRVQTHIVDRLEISFLGLGFSIPNIFGF